MLLSSVYFVKVIHQREVIGNFTESAHCKGTIVAILKQRGCALQIKVARDQDFCFQFFKRVPGGLGKCHLMHAKKLKKSGFSKCKI